jgi:gamma-glutamylcyclotransferase
MVGGPSLFYFAYGSNMDWQQMRSRCPSARFVSIGSLRDYRFAIVRRSRQRGCGVAGLLPFPGARVWGVVYELPESEVLRLDECEDYVPGRAVNSYWRRECRVHAPDRDLSAFTYFAEPEADFPPANAEYKRLILSGATYWGLPADYIAELEKIEVDGAR